MAKEERSQITVMNEEEARRKIKATLDNVPVLTGANSTPLPTDQTLRDIWNVAQTRAPFGQE